GRPQVEAIDVVKHHIREVQNKVVLYTPTWTGYYADSNYCSLPVGHVLIRQLLERDVTVILRAHPYTSKNRQSIRQLARLEAMLAADAERTGRKHVWGTDATEGMTLVECMNHADALVSDVSGVISDFLYSGKPYAVTDMVNKGDEFAESFP